MAKRTRTETDLGTFLRAQVEYVEATAAELGAELSHQLDHLADLSEAGGADFAARELERLATTSGLPEGSLGRSRIEHLAGMAFRFVLGGARSEALDKARELLERAYGSKARKRHPRAIGETALHLAHCYRDIGRTLPNAAREGAWSTSERLLNEAREALEKLGLPGAFHVASTLQSIANLAGERGDVKKARRFNKAARELVERRVRELGWEDPTLPNTKGLYASIVANSTVPLLQGDQERDLGLARIELTRALELVDDPRLRLRLAQANALLGLLDQANLDALASRQALTTLPERDLDEVPVLLSGGARTDAVDAFFYDVIERLTQVRSHQHAHHASDHTARRIQHFARHWAKLVGRNQPALALCIIEMNAALRMQEAIRFHQWRPQDPEKAAAFEEWTTRASLASVFGQWAAHIASLPAEARPLFVDTIRRSVTPDAKDDQDVLDFLDPDVVERFQTEFRRLEDSLSPADAFSRRAEQLDSEATEIRANLEEDASFVRAHASMRPIDEEDLLGLVTELKGTAILRLEQLREEILVFFADLDGKGALRVLAYSVAVAAEIVGRINLRDLWEEGHLADDVVRALERVDILSGVPNDAPRRVIVLQSGMLPLLPTLVLGPRGRTLLDRFDSIQNLWTLNALRVRVAETERAGTIALYPGRHLPFADKNATVFHAIAASASPGPDAVEMGRLTPLRAVVDAWSSARFVSFYGHGAHIMIGSPSAEVGPQLLLDTGELLGMRSLHQKTLGVERAELWACRSGLDFPWDPMFPMSEGFGFDYELTREGVRSTIGTLWSVDELVTSFVALRYRLGVREGLDSAHALSEAQRWWRDHARPRLVSGSDLAETICEIWRDLSGRDPGDGVHAVRAFLASWRKDPVKWKAFTESVMSPIAHAAYRFCGLLHEPLGTPPIPPKRSFSPEEPKPEVRRLSAKELAAFPVVRKEDAGVELGAFYDEATDLLAVVARDHHDDDFGFVILARASAASPFRLESSEAFFVTQAKAEAALMEALIARRTSNLPQTGV